jgi:hypothetical protein
MWLMKAEKKPSAQCEWRHQSNPRLVCSRLDVKYVTVTTQNDDLSDGNVIQRKLNDVYFNGTDGVIIS